MKGLDRTSVPARLAAFACAGLLAIVTPVPGFWPTHALADDGDDGGEAGGGAAGVGGGAPGGGGGPGGGPGGGEPGTSGGGSQLLRPTDNRAVFRLFRNLGLEIRSARSRPAPRKQRPRQELVATNLTATHLQALRRAGYNSIAERQLALLPGTTARLAGPAGWSADRAIARARALAPGAIVDRNDLYRQSYRTASGRAPAGVLAAPYDMVAWPRTSACGASGAIGMIDTAVDTEHPMLAGRTIARETVRSKDRAPSRTDHGTAMAVLLVGAGALGAVPGARLIAVDAFHRTGSGDTADAYDLVAALSRLSEQQVRVVSMSIAGPDNEVLDAAGTRATARGALIAAAVGNDGPSAGPRYPAAYAWAVAVTAVDHRGAVYSRAGRGEHLDLAAPGVRLALPDSRSRSVLRTGTSFAVPFVAGALATAIERNPGVPTSEVLAALARQATDLGEPGPDRAYGSGLLQMAQLCRG